MIYIDELSSDYSWNETSPKYHRIIVIDNESAKVEGDSAPFEDINDPYKP